MELNENTEIPAVISQRNSTVDNLKGLLIVLVVIGHIIFITEILFTIGTYIKQYVSLPKLNVWHFIIGFVYFSVLTHFLSLNGKTAQFKLEAAA